MKTEPRSLLKYLLSMATFFLVAASPLQDDDAAGEVLAQMRRTYDEMRDADLTFLQVVRFQRTNVEQSSSGRLLLKKGNRYRLELNEQTVVTNGTVVWSYSPSTGQVVIDEFAMDERTLSPEKILTGAPEDFVAAHLGKEVLAGRDYSVIKLIPRNPDSFIASLKLWVDTSTWLIKKAEVHDVGGRSTSYEIEVLKTNIGLDDEVFTYKIPEGAEVVDLR